MLSPYEARFRLADLRKELETPRVMYADQIGPQADVYRALAGLIDFLEDALAND